MNKKDLVFTVGLCVFMGVLWIVGELVVGLWIPVVPRFHLWWLVGIVAVTLVISVWHAMIEDRSSIEDPKRAKYQRKTAKKKKR